MEKLERARRLVQQGQSVEGLVLYAQLFKKYPQCGAEYGRAAAHLGDHELAVQVWEKVRQLEPNNPGLLMWLAAEHGKIGLQSKAFRLLAKASQIAPRNLNVLIKHAWLLSRTDSIEDAREAVARCLALESRNELALYLTALLDRREDKLEAAEKQLRTLLAGSMYDTQVRYSCGSELAHILDRTGRYEEAMEQLGKSKYEIRRSMEGKGELKNLRRFEKEIHETRSLPKNILQIWAKSFPARERAAVPSLAFLTGSSRSGTTLLEKILDAHPTVAAVDEPSAFLNVQRFVNCTEHPMPAAMLNSCRRRYVKNLAVDMNATLDGKVVLDKNPSLTSWLPALLRTFPELRVLIGLRDPRDVVVSLYFQDQSTTKAVTLEDLAQHYTDVMDIWLAVREWEGLNWAETRYENIVADLENEGRRVTQFLGLEWHADQARYHEKNRQKRILSNNFGNVTQPIYSRSVGRWRIYEKYLAPILPLLEPYCKEFGYEWSF